MMNPELRREKLTAAQTLIAELLADEEPARPQSVFPVDKGDNLISLIAEKPAGSTFILASDFVYEGQTFEILKSCTIASGLHSQRVGSDLIGPTFKIGTLKNSAPVTLRGLRLLGTHKDGAIVTAGNGLTLEYCLLDGGLSGVRRGILANAEDLTVHGCAILNCFHKEDAQAIVGWDGTKRITVTDSLLQASGENVMFGGADPANESRIPEDIELDGCTLSKPLDWRGRTDMTVKNIFELKNAKRVTLKNSILDGCWQQGQQGYAITLTVRNQDGLAPWSTIEDVVIVGNTIRNVGSGVQILGRDDIRLSGRMERVEIIANAFNIDRAFGGRGDQFFISGGPEDLTLADNISSGQRLHSFIYFDQPQYSCDALTVSGNTIEEGLYGIFSSAGLGVKALSVHAPGYAWAENKLRRTQTERWIGYPSGTSITT